MSLTPTREDKFSFGLWTVGNIGIDPFGEPVREVLSPVQIVELLAVISLAGWFNRWNNAIATVTDQESVDWARQHLTSVGWQLGKHAGEAHEQRRKHPRSTREDRLEY
jgi:hypothetical protein